MNRADHVRCQSMEHLPVFLKITEVDDIFCARFANRNFFRPVVNVLLDHASDDLFASLIFV